MLFDQKLKILCEFAARNGCKFFIKAAFSQGGNRLMLRWQRFFSKLR